MKKIFLGVLAAVIMSSIGVYTAFAAGSGSRRYFSDTDRNGVCDNTDNMCIYEDADGDGICDVCSTNHENCPTGNGSTFVNACVNNICDNYLSGQNYENSRNNGTQNGRGRNFVDADGDGICDNYLFGQNYENSRNNSTQNGCGRNFVDADGNGICDNYTTGQGHGCGFKGGRGNGFRGGRGR